MQPEAADWQTVRARGDDATCFKMNRRMKSFIRVTASPYCCKVTPVTAGKPSCARSNEPGSPRSRHPSRSWAAFWQMQSSVISVGSEPGVSEDHGFD